MGYPDDFRGLPGEGPAMPPEPPRLLTPRKAALPGYGDVQIMQHQPDRLMIMLYGPGHSFICHLDGDAFDILADLLFRAHEDRAR